MALSATEINKEPEAWMDGIKSALALVVVVTASFAMHIPCAVHKRRDLLANSFTAF